jgi:hypothetical protein
MRYRVEVATKEASGSWTRDLSENFHGANSLSAIDFVAREINKLRTEVSLQVIDSSSKTCSLRRPPRALQKELLSESCCYTKLRS